MSRRKKLRKWMIDTFRVYMGAGAGWIDRDIIRYMRENMHRLQREHIKKSGRNMVIHEIINDTARYQFMYPQGYYAYWANRRNKPRLHAPTERKNFSP